MGGRGDAEMTYAVLASKYLPQREGDYSRCAHVNSMAHSPTFAMLALKICIAIVFCLSVCPMFLETKHKYCNETKIVLIWFLEIDQSFDIPVLANQIK